VVATAAGWHILDCALTANDPAAGVRTCVDPSLLTWLESAAFSVMKMGVLM